MKTLCIIALSVLLAVPAWAKGQDGCGGGSCTDCHQLSREEAQQLLQKGGIDRVLEIKPAEVPGLWQVQVQKGEKQAPVFIDFSKSYVIAGNVIRLRDGNLVGTSRARSSDPERIDRSRIPLEDALRLGSSEAKTEVIVFTDPECPYCRKLHQELQKVVKRDPDIAFLIKLYPLKMHPKAYDISKSIVCRDSLELLEASFAGKSIPPANCDTPVVDQTRKLVGELGIRSTPTLVLPDGRVVAGFKEADALLRLLGANEAVPGPEKEVGG